MEKTFTSKWPQETGSDTKRNWENTRTRLAWIVTLLWWRKCVLFLSFFSATLLIRQENRKSLLLYIYILDNGGDDDDAFTGETLACLATAVIHIFTFEY